MKTKDALIATRKKIVKGWCKRAFAKDAKHNPVDVYDPRARYFCLEGALTSVCNYDKVYYAGLNKLLQLMPSPYASLTSFNDHNSKRAVVKLLTKAIRSYR